MRCDFCNSGNSVATFTCTCNFEIFCQEHLSMHISRGGNSHPLEKLDEYLEITKSQVLKKEAIARIKILERSKENILSNSRNIMKKIDQISKQLINNLDAHIRFYLKLISLKNFSISLKAEAEKVITTVIEVKETFVDIGLSIDEAFKCEIIKYSNEEEKNLKKTNEKKFEVDEKIRLIRETQEKTRNSEKTIEKLIETNNDTRKNEKIISKLIETDEQKKKDEEIIRKLIEADEEKIKKEQEFKRSEEAQALEQIRLFKEFEEKKRKENEEKKKQSESEKLKHVVPPSQWPINQKKEHFKNLFGWSDDDMIYVQDIKFSNNEKFLFICKIYIGKHK